MTTPERLDSLGVLTSIADRGRQVDRSASAARALVLPSVAGVTSVSVDLPAGASAPGTVGHAVAAVCVRSAAVPVIAAVDGAHSWLGPGALMITADAATAHHCRSVGALVVDLSAVDGADTFAGGLAASLVVLDRLALVGEMDGDLAQAAVVLDTLVVARGSTAADLARRIGRTMPIVYGAGPIGAVAAARWKSAVNRSAKAPAFANSIPGLDHDEVCGWAQHGDVTRQVMSLVTLRHGFEQPEAARRLESTAETCDEVVAGVYEVHAAQSPPLVQLLELATMGELVAVEMAALAGIDPGPLPVLERY